MAFPVTKHSNLEGATNRFICLNFKLRHWKLLESMHLNNFANSNQCHIDQHK